MFETIKEKGICMCGKDMTIISPQRHTPHLLWGFSLRSVLSGQGAFGASIVPNFILSFFLYDNYTLFVIFFFLMEIAVLAVKFCFHCDE